MKLSNTTEEVSMDKLKVGLVVDDTLDKPDGVQQYVLAVGEWLSSQGHEVHYLVGETKRRDLPRIHSLSKNVAVRFNGNRLSVPLPASKRAIRSLLRQESFDVLHVQMPYSPFMAKRIILCAPPGTAIVGTFHILPNSRLAAIGNRLLAVWLQKSLKRFNAVVSVSAAAATFARLSYGIRSDVLPNVVDYARFHNATPLPDYAGTMPNILFLGRLVPRKGCHILLEAVNQLLSSADKPPAFRVLICGKGPLEKSLKDYVRTNNMAKWVEFTGFVDEAKKPGYYASADIAVFPSSGGESFGIVLIEAMASGRSAVLAGNNPGYASVMGDRKDLLFEPTNAAELTQKLRLLLNNKDSRLQAAAWGAAYSQQFDIQVVGEKLQSLYAQALHSSRNVR